MRCTSMTPAAASSRGVPCTHIVPTHHAHVGRAHKQVLALVVMGSRASSCDACAASAFHFPATCALADAIPLPEGGHAERLGVALRRVTADESAQVSGTGSPVARILPRVTVDESA
jgi:hypothetical protein